LLVEKVQDDETSETVNVEDKIFHLSKVPSVVKVLEDYDIKQYPN
jgi:hypothetical protein